MTCDRMKTAPGVQPGAVFAGRQRKSMFFLRRVRAFLDLIKFEHALFALPFAYLGMLLAAGGWPSSSQFIWITVAMAAARTLAMSANRLADRELYSRNPRTAGRPLITGAINSDTVWAGGLVATAVLAIAAYSLGPLPFRLLPGAVAFLIGYPFTKRFTLASHFILGATDALAPLGAWAAVRGSLFTRADLPAWILFITVTLWIAGFDMIYACQDAEFDRGGGHFAGQGVEVEFVPVASAAERDQLMQAGQIDGMINDLVSTMFYNKDGTQIIVVSFARTATPDFPQYRILASKDSGIETVDDLRGVPIGISEGSVIAYTTDRLLEAEGLTQDDIVTVAVPKIPDRRALLLSGELKAANLPVPLSSLAIQGGAKVIIDDTSHPEIGNSLISFRKSVVEEHPEAIRAFMAAVEKAGSEINADKTRWSEVLPEKQLGAGPLLGTYAIPSFPTGSVPSEAQFADALAWTQEKGLLTGQVSYSESVDPSFLP